MRSKIFTALTSRLGIIIVIASFLGLQFVDGNISYFFGLFITLIAFWSSRFKWIEFGVGKAPFLKTLWRSILYAIIIFIIIDIGIQPWIEIHLGEIDLSNFEGLKGNLANYLIMLAIMWVFAAFGEEFVYRGYFMRRLAEATGNTDLSWLISGLIISTLFGIGHYYQGPSGMLTTGIVGFCFALIFMKNRQNLGLAMLTHGVYDVIGITLIYLDQERIFVDWFQSIVA